MFDISDYEKSRSEISSLHSLVVLWLWLRNKTLLLLAGCIVGALLAFPSVSQEEKLFTILAWIWGVTGTLLVLFTVGAEIRIWFVIRQYNRIARKSKMPQWPPSVYRG